jgi:hypothetical protein
VPIALNPILTREFDSHQRGLISKIKEKLFDLPLTHSSALPFEDDIKPFSAMKDARRGKTGQLDIDLGLDKCTFMTWGGVEKSLGYGRHHALIDTKKMLSDPRCFVTPSDIQVQVFDIERPYESLTPEIRGKVKKEYLQKILPGVMWLEKTAREQYYRVQRGEPMSLGYVRGLGEIKFFGTIPKSTIKEFIGPEDEHRVWVDLFNKGFVVGPIERSMPRATCGYDVTPQDLGLAGDEAINAWLECVDPAILIAKRLHEDMILSNNK